MDKIPDTIPFSSVILGERGRSQYYGIDELAESIREHGLIQPLVLERQEHKFDLGAPPGACNCLVCGENIWSDKVDVTICRFIVRAGGRRYQALARLGVTALHHATSAEPSRPGFLVAGIAADEFRGLMIEISENHNRSDIDWRDDVRLIVKAYRIWLREKHMNGERAIMLEFGSIIGVPSADLKWAVALHDDFVAHPDAYKDANGISPAYKTFLLRAANDFNKVAAERSFSRIPAFVKGEPQLTKEPSTPVEGEAPEPVCIPLSTQLYQGNGLDFMSRLADCCIDHVITDPDYAVNVATLSSNSDNMQTGVAQESVAESLSDLRRFLVESFRVTRSFCIFFYDLDHHEKLLSWARAAGWDTGNNTPLIWEKTDPPSNGAPNHNFPKMTEYAMVLRKPSTTLAQVQRTNVLRGEGQSTVRQFGHPFSKPAPLWRWLYSAVAIKGQVVLDPFAGKGSAPCAAVAHGLRPIACEIQDGHFNDLTLNLQAAYRGVLGPNLKFV